jgi:hypothetical protein
VTTVISAVYGGYDSHKVHVAQTVECDWSLLSETDDRRHPRMAAKEPKLRPWLYGDGPWIWIDGAFAVISPTFVQECLEASEGHAIAQWVHPWRDCIYSESDASVGLAKYADTPIRNQAEHYHDIGHPRHWGLWATGLIVYRERCDYLADLWWAELNRWGYQDQISQPVALRAAGMRPGALPGTLHQTPWLRWHPHRDEL